MEQDIIQSPIDRALALLAAPLNLSCAGQAAGQAAGQTAAKTPAMVVQSNSNVAPDETTAESDERRQHPRRDSSSRAMMSFGLMDVSDPAWTFRSTPHRGDLVDLSLRGAAFESKHPAKADSLVVLQLTGGDLDVGRVLRAKIIRCDQLDDGYCIVCRFAENLSLEDLYQYSRHRFSHDVV